MFHVARNLGLRIVRGMLLISIGVLAIFGLLGDASIYQRSLGINVNLIWGILLTLFGVVMLLLGRKRSAQ